MKMKGKLIVSLIWLVLAFVGIISATFAWLAENRSVQAGGMNVQAETVKNLLISNNSSSGYGISATSSIASNNAAKMTPASAVPTVVSGALKFYTPTDDTKANKIDFSTGVLKDGAQLTEATITSTTPQTNQTYSVMKYTFYLKVDGQQADVLYNLYASNVSITRGNPVSEISKALRVAVVCGNKAVFYSVTGGDTEYEGIASVSGSTFTTDDVTAYDSFDYSVDVKLADTVTTSPTTVDIYVWYEGQDRYCTSTNSLTIENLSVSVTFSASDTNN